MKLLAFWGVWLHMTVSILGILMYVVSTHALQQHRHPAAAVSWMLCFFFVPYLALPAYLFFGQRKIRPGSADSPLPLPIAPSTAPGRHWLSSMLMTLGALPARAEGRLTLHTDAAQAEAALWRLIDGARSRLMVSTYVLGDDRIGRMLIERLARRAREGIEVYLLLDGVGCLRVPASRLAPLVSASGHVARAFPPLRRLLHRQSNIRNHRKLVCVDGHLLWSGGRNFADEYFAGNAERQAWFDLSFDVDGPMGADGETIFRHDWALATGLSLPAAASACAPAEAVDAADAAASDVQLLPSGPDQPIDSLEALLVTACFRARRRILIVTPYLIPNSSLLQAMMLAARRQVQVDVVIPRRSNHRLADYARSRAIRQLATAGVRIWLAPKMNHAKACVFDDLALCGSANLDSRSLFLNFEVTAVFYRAEVGAEVAAWIEARRAESQRYEPRPVTLARDLFEGAVLWLGFQL
ncbi:MAG: phospholipase D-like domain-containing protein [Burkholderiaceae bacterium]